jgi:5-methylcytosine-specific restriction endonuclease McrA
MRSEDSLANLSERQLLTHFGDLVRKDQRHTAQLLAAIAEIDERKLWAKHACPSMFAFCVERFHMSESMTGERIWAARTARRFPVILRMVARGELHLSAIMQLAKHLTEDNHRGLLLRARHKSSREIDLLVAELAPRPDAPTRIRALPRPTGFVVRAEPESGAEPEAAGACAAREGPGRDVETHDKLRTLQDLLAHELSGADPAIIVSHAIDRLLDDTLKKKAAVTDQARRRDPGSKTRNDRRTRAIPAAIRREVWQRDGGRCTFVDQHGRRCQGTRAMEYHHQRPYGKGGQHGADNIALRCRAHNQYQADLDFGRVFMRDKRRRNSPHSARHV